MSDVARCPRCAAPVASPEDRCGVCGSPCDLEPSPPELVRFERGLALALLVAFLLLWKVALDATAGPADVRAPDTVADLQAAWQRGEGRGALLGLALFFTASVYCAVRFQRTIRTAMKALRARPAPTVGPVPLGAFLVAFGLFTIASSLGVAGQRRPRLVPTAATPGAQTDGHPAPTPLGRKPVRLVGDGERTVLIPPPAEAKAEPGSPEPGGQEPGGQEPGGQDLTWSGTLAWGLFGVGQLEVANTAAVGSATPVALDGKPLEPGVVYEVWPGARVTAPGLALTVDAPDWTERSARNLVGQVLGLLLLLGLARLATPGLLTRLGVRTEGFAREVKRGAAAYLAFFPVVWAVLMLTQILAGALGYPAQSHPLVRALERDPGGLLAVLVFLQAAVLAPLVEELIYRGVALGGLLRPFGPLGAVLASAVLFAAVHPGFAHFLPMIALGSLFAGLRATSPTGSLVGSVTAHLMHNGLTLLLVFAA